MIEGGNGLADDGGLVGVVVVVVDVEGAVCAAANCVNVFAVGAVEFFKDVAEVGAIEELAGGEGDGVIAGGRGGGYRPAVLVLFVNLVFAGGDFVEAEVAVDAGGGAHLVGIAVAVVIQIEIH